MGLFREILNDGLTNKPSSKRVSLLVGISSLAVSTLVLAIAAFTGNDVGVAITGTSASLATAIGYIYVQGKRVERENGVAVDQTVQPPD